MNTGYAVNYISGHHSSSSVDLIAALRFRLRHDRRGKLIPHLIPSMGAGRFRAQTANIK